MNVRIRQLKALLTIVETGSVTAAAGELNLTQSTVSKLLAGLELEVGFELFDRVGKRLRLTEKGRLFLRQARLALEAIENVTKSVEDIQSNHGQSMRISAIGPLSMGLLVPNAIAQMARQHPEFTIIFDGKARVEIEEWVAQGRANFGFTLLPVSHSALTAKEFTPVSAFAVVPVDHPLSSRSKLRPADLIKESVIMLNSAARVRGLVEASFMSLGLKLTPKIEASNAISAVYLVSQGAGIAVLDPFSCMSVPPEQVRLIRWEPETPLTYGMIYQSNRVLSDIEHDVFDTVSQNIDAYLSRLAL